MATIAVMTGIFNEDIWGEILENTTNLSTLLKLTMMCKWLSVNLRGENHRPSWRRLFLQEFDLIESVPEDYGSSIDWCLLAQTVCGIGRNTAPVSPLHADFQRMRAIYVANSAATLADLIHWDAVGDDEAEAPPQFYVDAFDTERVQFNGSFRAKIKPGIYFTGTHTYYCNECSVCAARTKVLEALHVEFLASPEFVQYKNGFIDFFQLEAASEEHYQSASETAIVFLEEPIDAYEAAMTFAGDFTPWSVKSEQFGIAMRELWNSEVEVLVTRQHMFLMDGEVPNRVVAMQTHLVRAHVDGGGNNE